MIRRVVAVALVIALAGCSGGRDAGDDPDRVAVNESACLDAPERDEPVVTLIQPAMTLIDDRYGAAQEYFEVSADRRRVSLVVATEGGAAEQSFYCGDLGLTEPTDLGPASGQTFGAGALEFDAASVFDGIRGELDDPEIVDFAIVGAGEGAVVYDATVRSDSGGLLRIMVNGAGDVLGVQTD